MSMGAGEEVTKYQFHMEKVIFYEQKCIEFAHHKKYYRHYFKKYCYHKKMVHYFHKKGFGCHVPVQPYCPPQPMPVPVPMPQPMPVPQPQYQPAPYPKKEYPMVQPAPYPKKEHPMQPYSPMQYNVMEEDMLANPARSLEYGDID